MLTILSLYNFELFAQRTVTGGVSFTIGRNSRNCFRVGVCTVKPIKVTVAIKRLTNSTVTKSDLVTILERESLSNREFNSLVIYDSKNLTLFTDQKNLDIISKEMDGIEYIIEEDYNYIDEENSVNYTMKAGKYPILFDSAKELYYITF